MSTKSPLSTSEQQAAIILRGTVARAAAEEVEETDDTPKVRERRSVVGEGDRGSRTSPISRPAANTSEQQAARLRR